MLVRVYSTKQGAQYKTGTIVADNSERDKIPNITNGPVHKNLYLPS